MTKEIEEFLLKGHFTLLPDDADSGSYKNLQFVTLELGSTELRKLICCARCPLPTPSHCWPRNWTTLPQKHYQTKKVKGRYQSVTQVECHRL